MSHFAYGINCQCTDFHSRMQREHLEQRIDAKVAGEAAMYVSKLCIYKLIISQCQGEMAEIDCSAV